MTSTLTCPDETELLALAMGETAAAAVTAHVAGCASCQTQLDRLQAEVASLRQNHAHGPTPPSTERSGLRLAILTGYGTRREPTTMIRPHPQGAVARY